MAIRLADTTRPNNYVDAEHKGTFPVAYAEDIWFEDGTRLSEKTFDGQSIQKEELPLASADELGNIYQYVGETGTYTNRRFYKCILNSSVYSWSEIKMVEKPVVYSETVPDINAYETGSIVCYTGEDSGSFEKGHLYQKNETSFTYLGGGSKLDNVFLVKDSEGATTLAVSQRTFTGTQAEWDALTTNEKLTYKQVNITDDESSTECSKEYIRNQNILSGIETVTLPMTASYDGELIVLANNGGYAYLSINGSVYIVGSSVGMTNTSGLLIKKGDNLQLIALIGNVGFTARYYKLRDYTGR